MDDKLILLKLALDAMGIPFDIKEKDDRVKIQKAICLAQIAGLNFGYRYNWYINGPYSPDLAVDYFQLNEQIKRGENTGNWTLSPADAETAQVVRSAFQRPADVGLTDVQWIEMVASYAYLRHVSGYPPEQAQKLMKDKKPWSADWLERVAKIID